MPIQKTTALVIIIQHGIQCFTKAVIGVSELMRVWLIIIVIQHYLSIGLI